MGLIEHIHPYFAELDYKTKTTKLVFIVVSFSFFSTTYIVSHLLAKLTSTYSNLRVKEKVFWNLAVIRGLYGAFCIVIGIWVIFFDSTLRKNPVFATCPTSFLALTVTNGFFVFECATLVISDIKFGKSSILLHIHHWLTLGGCSCLMFLDSPHFFATTGLTLEMSTPFSAICWILLKAGYADSLLWKINQFILVHTFHLRSVVECYMWYVTYQNWELVWRDMPAIMFAFLYTQLVLVTFLMTPYWTYKKTQQMIIPVDWNFEDNGSQKSNKKHT